MLVTSKGIQEVGLQRRKDNDFTLWQQTVCCDEVPRARIDFPVIFLFYTTEFGHRKFPYYTEVLNLCAFSREIRLSLEMTHSPQGVCRSATAAQGSGGYLKLGGSHDLFVIPL